MMRLEMTWSRLGFAVLAAVLALTGVARAQDVTPDPDQVRLQGLKVSGYAERFAR